MASIRSLLEPGAILEALLYVLTDPQSRYGGNLLGTYTDSTSSFPAATISERPPNVLGVKGLELVLDPIPVESESQIYTNSHVQGVWCAYCVQRSGGDRANLTLAYTRLLSTTECSVYYLKPTDQLDCDSQFKLMLPFETTLKTQLTPRCLDFQLPHTKETVDQVEEFIQESKLFKI